MTWDELDEIEHYADMMLAEGFLTDAEAEAAQQEIAFLRRMLLATEAA